MRKQNKIVAVASAAALLAIGASMTSFAATGWVEEDGQWYFYDRDGNRVEDEWRRSGDNWYWLDSEEEGAMAADKLVEDDDDTYYVDANGVMVTNTWVRVVNEDQDEEDDPAEYHYYYMQNNGKAYKAGESGSLRRRTIDGKQYAFDDDGVMLYGWVSDDGERITGDTGWSDATGEVYYFGGWEDGSMKTGWQQISVYDETREDDYSYWFNFRSNGRLRKNNNDWSSNGRHYRFDERGVMVYQWAPASLSDASTATTSDAWQYFSSPEDGARMTRGWFKVVPPTEDNSFLETDDTFATGDSADESERWYYADNNGTLKVGTIDRIGGRYYGFYPEGANAGRMLTGLCVLKVNEDDSSIIESVIEADIDSDSLEDILDGTYSETGFDSTDSTISLYYFGNDEDTDGSMKTGSTTINLDGETYNFMFKQNGSNKTGRGRGVTGIDDNKYIYQYGCRIKASTDDRYQLVSVTNEEGGSVNTNASGVIVTKVDAPAFTGTGTGSYDNRDDERVNYNILQNSNLYLVNTSGSLQRNRDRLRDGNDCYYYVDGYDVKLYTDNNELRTENDAATVVRGNDWEDLINAFAPTTAE